MRHLRLHVLSLRYSSWSIRPWLALTAAHAPFETETVEIEGLGVQTAQDGPGLVQVGPQQLSNRRMLGLDRGRTEQWQSRRGSFRYPQGQGFSAAIRIKFAGNVVDARALEILSCS